MTLCVTRHLLCYFKLRSPLSEFVCPCMKKRIPHFLTTVQALSDRWGAVQQLPIPLHPTELSALHAAYLACVAEALSTKAPNAALSTFLQINMANAHLPHNPSSPATAAATVAVPVVHLAPELGAATASCQPSKTSLVSVLLSGCYHQQAVLRIEALAAVRGLAIHYAFTIPGKNRHPLHLHQMMRGTPNLMI